MKLKTLTLLLVSLILTIGVSSCSNNDYDPEDYISSILSGSYEKDGLWKLYVTENGVQLDSYGSVRFDSKYLEVADIKFIDVIPGESVKEFNDVTLTESEDGVTFTIDYLQNEKSITITGLVTLGKMTIDIQD